MASLSIFKCPSALDCRSAIAPSAGLAKPIAVLSRQALTTLVYRSQWPLYQGPMAVLSRRPLLAKEEFKGKTFGFRVSILVYCRRPAKPVGRLIEA